jgi:hypothetical protein
MTRKVKALPAFIWVIFSIGFVACFFVLANNPVSAADGKLTNEKALQTVAQVLHCYGACKMRVIGVQEVPQQNMAQADVEISNITFKIPKNDAVTAYAFGPGGGTRIWSGHATAIFAHYNDGRWVLRQIICELGNWDNLNIVVGSKLQEEGTGRLNEIRRDGRFIAYGNGTVLDTQTNLMWAAKDNGSNINWPDAKSYCENYRGGGYTDWRMPTRDEKAGLYDASKSRPAGCWQNKNLHFATELIDITGCGFWSSETRGSEAAAQDFSNGNRVWVRQSFDRYSRVLPVRFNN